MKTNQSAPSEAFPIIGVGASAGGLEAFSQLLSNLPADSGMAFVFVQHLDPKHESKLGQILGKSTRMPVLDAIQGQKVEPNNVYVIPRNTTLTIRGGVLELTPRDESHWPYLPIDQFFKSLAIDRQTSAIGVVLSGNASDGTLGLEEIKAAGGITFAQSRESAKFPGMPQSAMRSGCVDLELPVEAIASELMRINGHPYIGSSDASPNPEGEEQLSPSDVAGYHRILALVRAGLGVDFRGYRDTTVRRRIRRRMVLHTKENLGEYADQLEKDPLELAALRDDILINVTSFFREPSTFEVLKTHVFPEILASKTAGSPIRFWVPGCSTGQEAYSLAMVLVEFMEENRAQMPVQIFATDLSDAVALQKGREGLYPESIEGELTPERLRRFFSREEGRYRINKSIRELCIFAKQNVAADPPFSKVDLISCRNLLIYLAPSLQKRVIPTFHYALNTHGFLLLGASETIGTSGDMFALIDQKHRIYQKKPVVKGSYPHFNTGEIHLGPRALGAQRAPQLATMPVDWQREADRMVLGQYSPAGVLVNEAFDVIQFRGQTGRYLAPAPGDASFNLLKMARDGLFLELRSALTESREQNKEAHRSGIRIRGESNVAEISIQVLPLRLSGISERCFLVLFGNSPEPLSQTAADAAVTDAADNDRELVQLRRELASTREYLQSVIEQQDSANEELKAANEEILSSNEELQSTNEELETAKEELQSVNEELTTMNEQLQNRNTELIRLNDDVSNLLQSANVPMVALDANLRIRRFTPAAAVLLNLLPGDVGRSIGNLRPPFEISDLDQLLEDVRVTHELREREVRDREGRWHMLRIHPFRTAERKVDGLVVVLHDIDELKKQAERLHGQAELIDLCPDAIIRCDGHTRLIAYWNRGAEQLYGWTSAEATGKSVNDLLKTAFPSDLPEVREILQQKGFWEGELIHTRRDGSQVATHSKQVLVRDGAGEIAAILEINRDITNRKLMEENLKGYANRLAEADRRKDEFLAMLAHELRNPMTPVRNGLHALRLMNAQANVEPEKRMELQEMMERQVRHMTRLVDDLLDVPRITHGHIELRKEPLQLTALVKDAVREVQSQAETEGLELSVTLAKEPIVIDADPVRLEQILENLLINAIKYTDRGGRIEVLVGCEGSDAAVRVRDTGIGIDRKMQPHIWELFAQADGSVKRARGGLGIGLALVRHLVQLHGGTIEVHSEGLGKGSEFVLKMPLGDFAGSDLLLRAAPRERPKPSVKHTRRHILVVDDNVDAARTLEMLMKLIGHRVDVAHTGAEAIEMVSHSRPNVVLLDLGLPVMTGYEVARRLRETCGDNLCLVAVSGYGSKEARQQTIEAGFNGHFVKPVDTEALIEFIEGIR